MDQLNKAISCTLINAGSSTPEIANFPRQIFWKKIPYLGIANSPYLTNFCQGPDLVFVILFVK